MLNLCLLLVVFTKSRYKKHKEDFQVKKFIVILSFFAVAAFAAGYDNSEGGYYDDPRQDRSTRNEILREAGCKAINALGNGRYLCLRWPR